MDKDTSADQPTKSRISKLLGFWDVAKLLEKVSSANETTTKLKYLSSFVGFVREKFHKKYGTLDASKAENDSIFCLMRILLPYHDKSRKKLNVSNAQLAKMFCQSLGLTADSPRGESLLSTAQKAPNSDMSSVIFNIVGQDAGKKERQVLEDLHNVLDIIAKNTDTRTHKEQGIVNSFISKLSKEEAKWFSKMVTRKMNLGLPNQQILKVIHPHAPTLFREVENLEQVCLKLNDPNAAISSNNIVLFKHCRLMLCSRLNSLDIGDIDEPTGDLNGHRNALKLPPPPFIVEIKYDGERCAIHYDSSIPEGCKFKIFSRNGRDYTENYQKNFVSFMEDLVKPGCQSFIMDGEMMLYNRKTREFKTKGAGADVKWLKSNQSIYSPCFIAFDLLYFNGEQLTGKPIEKRLSILDNEVVEVDEEIIRISERKILRSKVEVEDELNAAIGRLEEGLIIKEQGSIYVGKRDKRWLKIKPENIDGNAVTDLDLLIVGIMCSNAEKIPAGVNDFLVGAIDDNQVVWPLVKVGTGQIRKADILQMVRELQPYFTEQKPNNIYWEKGHQPYRWIEPKHSYVLQIKASEITPSKNNDLEFTLRFPRPTRIRRDKCWTQIHTVKDLKIMISETGGKLAVRSDGLRKNINGSRKPAPDSDTDEDIMSLEDEVEPMDCVSQDGRSSRLQVKRVKSNTSLRGLQTSGKSEVESPLKVLSHTFASEKFYVVGTDDWKTEIVSKIYHHGGEISLSAKEPLLCAVIAEKVTARVKDLISNGRHDILKESWIEKCFKAEKMVEIHPEDCWYAKPTTKALLNVNYDRFGNSYAKQMSSAELKNLLQEALAALESEDSLMQIENLHSEIQIQDASSTETASRIGCSINSNHYGLVPRMLSLGIPSDTASKLQKFWFFEGTAIYLLGDSWMKEILCSKIKFYGGKVCSSGQDGNITHVVILGATKPVEFQANAAVVNDKWLIECIEHKQLLDATQYLFKS